MLPLVANFRPEAPVAWRGVLEVSQQRFLHDALRLAAKLPEATYAFNLCQDRYHFLTAFAAVCLRGQTNLLPPNQSAEGVSKIAIAYPGHYALTDQPSEPGSMCVVRVEDSEAEAQQSSCSVPGLPASHVAAVAFTSGTTGSPKAYPKTWRTLVHTAQLAAQRFMGAGYNGANIVATVPPQHMYGLETTVMMALASGCAMHAGHTFFPVDLRTALSEVPAPRALVTTPAHLRACLTAGVALPELHMIISATAPLSADLASLAEARFSAPVYEIYGCTEAGSMATRRTVRTEKWQFYRGMTLELHDTAVWVRGDHLPEPVPLPDMVEDLGNGRFKLIGRTADMLKVAGKRASLSALTQLLLRIPGVDDAVVFVPDGQSEDAARPAALVVAPQLDKAQILAALGRTVDPVFLPRPLIRVESLPHNSLGKLSRAALLEQLEKHRG